MSIGLQASPYLDVARTLTTCGLPSLFVIMPLSGTETASIDASQTTRTPWDPVVAAAVLRRVGSR